MEKRTFVTRLLLLLLLLMLLVLQLLLLLPSFKRRFVDRTGSTASADRLRGVILSSIMMNVVVVLVLLVLLLLLLLWVWYFPIYV
jgi:hypothetical protein